MNNFKNKLSSFFLLDEEDLIENNTEEKTTVGATERLNEPSPVITVKKEPVPKNEKRVKKQSGGENVVAINQKQASQNPQITIVEPRLHSEGQEVADYLLVNQTIILNFRRMDKEQAAKMLDFLMGVTYSIKGDIQRLDEEIFICTPQSVTLNGADLSEFTDSLL